MDHIIFTKILLGKLKFFLALPSLLPVDSYQTQFCPPLLCLRHSIHIYFSSFQSSFRVNMQLIHKNQAAMTISSTVPSFHHLRPCLFYRSMQASFSKFSLSPQLQSFSESLTARYQKAATPLREHTPCCAGTPLGWLGSTGINWGYFWVCPSPKRVFAMLDHHSPSLPLSLGQISITRLLIILSSYHCLT